MDIHEQKAFERATWLAVARSVGAFLIYLTTSPITRSKVTVKDSYSRADLFLNQFHTDMPTEAGPEDI